MGNASQPSFASRLPGGTYLSMVEMLLEIAADVSATATTISVGDAADGIHPKDAMLLATAFKAATQAHYISSDRRRKLEKDFASKVTAAVDTAAKAAGMTRETAEKIKAEILGV